MSKVNFIPDEEVIVTMRVTGRVLIPVKGAKNLEEAKAMAEQAWSEMDFGPLEDIDGNCVCCDDSQDNREYYE